jgi:hypothetical protein
MEEWVEEEALGYLEPAEELAHRTQGKPWRELSTADQNQFLGLATELSELLQDFGSDMTPATRQRTQGFLEQFPKDDLQGELAMDATIAESLEVVGDLTGEKLKEYIARHGELFPDDDEDEEFWGWVEDGEDEDSDPETAGS